MGFHFAIKCNIHFQPLPERVLILVGIFFFTFIYFPLSAQNLAENTVLHGKLIQQSDSTSVPFAHVINLRNGRGTSTSANGIFAMVVQIGDTVLFTALGFHNHSLLVDEKILENKQLALIVLEEKTYDLPIVEIYPFSTFTDFKYAFLNFKDPDPGMDLNLPKSFINDVPGENFGITIKGPITALYNQFSKRGKELRKYQEVVASDELHRKASRVVNVETVRRYTDLRDEAEIYRFLRFCNMSDEFIVSNNEYIVYQQLLACYQMYCKIEK